jgi:hypothetical protein
MSAHNAQFTIEAAILKKIAESLKEIRFGSLTITVQNGRVVQLERAEKTRFDRETVNSGEGI